MLGDFNSFSLLNLNVEDDRSDIAFASGSPSSSSSVAISSYSAGNKGKRVKGKKLLENGGEVKTDAVSMQRTPIELKADTVSMQRTSQIPEREYKYPLAWIDLEMTGLDLEVDRIIEIACIITDGNLNRPVEGPNLIIHQTKECMDNMGEWCKKHHGESGLTNQVLQSNITEEEAEKRVMEFVQKHVGISALLAGNSIHADYSFLKKYMPKLANMFSHVLVDVSSVSSLCLRWCPNAYKKAPRKKKNHRALDDIRESITELKYYRENIFKLEYKKK
ncbi:Oligoribonuclease [Zostera marina]|uniref:Oligoribonuclease n=1 Tax=Zostera marina TaxID=29655 RepID=A0A0K9PIG0_ZOSMR|nr:Oligoribonuclease [Zostera marina]